MKKIYLSVPMKKRTNKDIEFTIEGMKRIITAMYPNEKLEFVTGYDPEFNNKGNKILALSSSLAKMATCDYVADILCGPRINLWRSQGVNFELQIARAYGLKVMGINDPYGDALVPDLLDDSSNYVHPVSYYEPQPSGRELDY